MGLSVSEERLGDFEAWVDSYKGTIAVLLLKLSYYFVCEATTGRTLGKLVTRTIVVDAQGQRASTLKVLARTALRLVPLGWIGLAEDDRRALHDFASKTFVVNVQKPANPSLERP